VSRSIRTFLPVPGTPEDLAAAFEGDPRSWFTGAPSQRSGGSVSITTPVRAGALAHPVILTFGVPWQVGATRWRPLRWEPAQGDGSGPLERLLPSFEGELGLHLYGAGRCTLLLDGRYEPPGAALGQALDAVALHRVARSTVERLLEDVAAQLTAQAVLIDGLPAKRSTRRHAPHKDRPTAVSP
jgi:hypothetical protein